MVRIVVYWTSWQTYISCLIDSTVLPPTGAAAAVVDFNVHVCTGTQEICTHHVIRYHNIGLVKTVRLCRRNMSENLVCAPRKIERQNHSKKKTWRPELQAAKNLFAEHWPPTNWKRTAWQVHQRRAQILLWAAAAGSQRNCHRFTFSSHWQNLFHLTTRR